MRLQEKKVRMKNIDGHYEDTNSMSGLTDEENDD